MGRPRRHDETTERELLDAAEGLLATEGAEGLSVRRLAEAAGTTPRAIYSVFGGKDGLLRALFREAFDALSADIDALPASDDPRADLIAAGVQGFRGWARRRPDLFRLVFDDRPASVSAADAEAGQRAFGRLMARVRRCAAAGVIAPGTEPQVGLAFHALCEGLASLERRGRFPLGPIRDAEAAWTSALSALVAGYAPRA